MNKKFAGLVEELTQVIQNSYESSVTIEEAEKLAGRFLHAQIIVSEELRRADLDARMKKSGLKALEAGTYLDGALAGEKKPSDVLLNATVDSNDLVKVARKEYDTAEVEKSALLNYFGIFKEAHIFFRGVSRGRFE